MTLSRDELLARCALRAQPGVGDKTARRLIARYHTALDAIEALRAGRERKLTYNDAAATTILKECESFLAAPSLETPFEAPLETPPTQQPPTPTANTSASHRWLACAGEPDYPPALPDLPDAPAFLFARGNPRTFHDMTLGPVVAIVGTRKADSVGLSTAETIAHDLAKAGVTVISGGAEGIDQAAHTGAMLARHDDPNAPTGILVAGGGLFAVAREKRRFLLRFLDAGGIAVSEAYPETPVGPAGYQRRNRIIAALADITLVVEADAKSGALITAEAARRIYRTVAACRIESANPTLREGTELLIKNGATPVAAAADLLALLASRPPRVAPHPPMMFHRAEVMPPLSFAMPSDAVANTRLTARDALGITTAPALDTATLDPEEQKLLATLHDSQNGCAVDELVRACALPPPRVNAALLSLELRGLVLRTDGGNYRAAGRSRSP